MRRGGDHRLETSKQPNDPLEKAGGREQRLVFVDRQRVLAPKERAADVVHDPTAIGSQVVQQLEIAFVGARHRVRGCEEHGVKRFGHVSRQGAERTRLARASDRLGQLAHAVAEQSQQFRPLGELREIKLPGLVLVLVSTGQAMGDPLDFLQHRDRVVVQSPDTGPGCSPALLTNVVQVFREPLGQRQLFLRN
jgi:hypothetical protein